jgi:hypothetical protein
VTEPNKLYKQLSEELILINNLDCLSFSITLISGKLKYSRQFVTMSLDVVRNILNRVLLTAKFNEFASVRVIGHASKPYMRQGKHLALIILKVTSSEADLPTLL